METPFDYLEAKINGVSLSEAYKMGFQAGIKLVVEWVGNHALYHQEARMDINWDEWQNKLKEWGISPE